MKSIAISNVQDLKTEINRLRIIDDEQSTSLKFRFSSPSAIFASALTLFPKSGAVSSVTSSGLFHEDFVSMISRFLIPLTLNKTLFRHSNFLVKMMVGVVSQKASGYISDNALENIFRKGKSLISKLFSKKETTKVYPGLNEMKPAVEVVLQRST